MEIDKQRSEQRAKQCTCKKSTHIEQHPISNRHQQDYSHEHHWLQQKRTQIKELDYCHHPQTNSCCLGFLDILNLFLIPMFIT